MYKTWCKMAQMAQIKSQAQNVGLGVLIYPLWYDIRSYNFTDGWLMISFLHIQKSFLIFLKLTKLITETYISNLIPQLLVGNWNFFCSVVVGDPICRRFHEMHKMHMKLFCGCDIQVIICCNYFLILLLYLFTPTDNVSLANFSTQILSPVLFFFSDQLLHNISSPILLLKF